jgi:hypothetical protein
MTQPTPGTDPWNESTPRCRVAPDSPRFRQLLEDRLGESVQLLGTEPSGPREAVLVDCIDTAAALGLARQQFPSLPRVGVIAAPDAARIIEALASGADGVIALTDPVDGWRECLHVVLGGGRWLGGPGLEISLEQKHASYDVARREDHAGDVTMRTKLFVRSRLGDKFRP